VVKEAKRLVYNNQVTNSANKMKTIWNIIKLETNRQWDIQLVNFKILLMLLINIFYQQLEELFRTLVAT
jgi:hypothetical protein